MKSFTIRLLPGQDLLKSIMDFIRAERIEAGCILTCVGSLTKAVIRYANQETNTKKEGHFEIVSLVGTVAMSGAHLHISISDGQGRTIGGHLMPGCIIYTTAEIVIAFFPDLVYRREMCEESGYQELVVYSVHEILGK